MARHSKLSPSGSKRWMLCPGSIGYCEELGIKDSASVYAMEGTAAHYLGEQCLRHKWDVDKLRGKKIHVEEWNNHDDDKDNFFHTGFYKSKRTDTKGMTLIYHEAFEVNDNMIDAVQVYIDYVLTHMAFGGELLLEVKCPLTHLKIPGLDGGTSDTIMIFIKRFHVTVADYKHGQGVAVDAYDNPQTNQYGLGVLEVLRDRGVDVTDYTVDLVIIQPRASHPHGPIRTHSTTAKELYHWQASVLIPAAKLTQDPDAPLVAGEEQCRFCPASPCPTQDEFMDELLVADFADLVDKESTENVVAALTIERKAEIFTHAGFIRAYVVKVENKIKEEMDAGSTDYEFDFKLVLTQPHRKLLPDATDEIMSPLFDHLEEEDIFRTMPNTLTLLESKLKKILGAKEARQIMDEVTERPEGTTVVALLSDKRQEILPSTETDFDGLED